MQFAENRALLSGELDWKRYLKPRERAEFSAFEEYLAECKRIDEFNRSTWEYNNSMLPKINDLRAKMGETKYKLDAPPQYYSKAYNDYLRIINEETYRIIHAVEFLYKRDKLAIRDYALKDGPVLADQLAEEEEIKRRVSSDQLIDITEAAGINHCLNCTCNNKWDGKSARCIGEGIRLNWVREKQHHFQHPKVKPEVH
jgi:hypothetical protein